MPKHPEFSKSAVTKAVCFLSGVVVFFGLTSLLLRPDLRTDEQPGTVKQLAADVAVYQEGAQVGVLKAGTLVLHKPVPAPSPIAA